MRGTGPPRTQLHKAVGEDDAAYGSLSDSHVKEQKTADASQRHRSGSTSSKMSGIAGANPSRAVHLHRGDMVISPQNSMGLDPPSARSGREIEPRSIMRASSLRMSSHHHVGACLSSFKRKARGPQHDSVAHIQQAEAAVCRPIERRETKTAASRPRRPDWPRVFQEPQDARAEAAVA